MAAKITKPFIAGLKMPGHGNKVYYDTDVPGFGVRVTATGAKSFVFNYRTRTGRERRMTIAPCNALSITDAREEAKRLRGEVALGGDPLGDKKALRSAPTVKDLANEFREFHLPRLRPATRRAYEAHLVNDILPAFGSRKVADIEHSDIEVLHRKISKRGSPYVANRTVATLSKMFTLAIKRRWRADNPAKGIERNPETKRTRYLSGPELAALSKSLAETDDQQGANIIRLLTLTGARSGETMAAKWADIDLDTGVWTKPGATTKTGTLHQIPLSAPALQLLSDLREQAKPDAIYVFPAKSGKSGHRTIIAKTWRKLCKGAGVKDARVHDLRHTYASILVSSGLSLPIVGALLGHTQPATTSRYAHLQHDPLREATERAGAIISGNQGADVVPIKITRQWRE